MLPIGTMMIMKTKDLKLSLVLMILTFNFSLQTNAIQKMSYVFMGDQLSFWSTNLALWVAFIIVFMKTKNQEFHTKIMMMTTLIFMMIFYIWNLMIFYMIFEVSMIIMLLIMISWSYQPERTEAIMFLIMMAMMFSLPFLVTALNNTKFLNFWFMKMSPNLWTYVSLIVMFMMKMPIYFIHFWLPKVHVEAPIQGSMILAAIMLKLGCYGLIRIMPLMKMFKKINIYLTAIAMWAMIMLSASCFIQIDIKTLIAYSSVVHMMIILIVVLINKKKSITASTVIIVSHGLCASALFLMSNIFYKNSKSRSIMMNKGSSMMMLAATPLWFMVCMSNTPMPPAISMIGELLSLKLMLNWTSMYSMIFIITLFSSLYSIFIFYIMVHGKFSKMSNIHSMLMIKTILITILHIIPVIGLTIKVKMMIII